MTLEMQLNMEDQRSGAAWAESLQIERVTATILKDPRLLDEALGDWRDHSDENARALILAQTDLVAGQPGSLGFCFEAAAKSAAEKALSR